MSDNANPSFVAAAPEAPSLAVVEHGVSLPQTESIEEPQAYTPEPDPQQKSEPLSADAQQAEPIPEVEAQAEAVPEVQAQTEPIPEAAPQAQAETIATQKSVDPDVPPVPQPIAETAVPTAEAPAPKKSSGPRTVGFDPSVEERKQRAEQHWLHVVASRDSGETLEGTVTSAVKGGLLVDVGGVRGFLPASQTRLEPGTDIASLVKTKVPLRVIDVDENRRRVVVSQRRALDDQRRTKRTELLRSLKIGQLHEGVVVRLAPFGAFVDIGGLEGLVPMSELAFERVEKVEDVLKVGERLPVSVLRIDEGGRKIGLSRKNALPDPLRDHAALLRPGTVIEGKVVAKDSRLQVEIAPGVIGSIRESDADPNDYEIGEAIEVSVRYVDRRNRRIVLTTLHGAATALPRSSGFAPLGEELRRRLK